MTTGLLYWPSNKSSMTASRLVSSTFVSCQAILRQPVFSANLGRNLGSVSDIDVCGVDESLKKHRPGLLH